MKIPCDVCTKNHASFFCTADEAALCDGCDRRVHHANKLASKHQRFSLHHPSAHQLPLCDVCQERRAFVFCQQDRAILCKECDSSIHSANDHTKSHSRFLLTGIKLSDAAVTAAADNPVVDDSRQVSQPIPVANNSSPSTTEESAGGFTSSSISEYLMKTIPGWQVEDFLDPPPSVPSVFSKNQNGYDVDLLQVFDGDEGGNMVSFSAKSMGGIWVPQAPAQMNQHIGYKEATNNNTKGRGSRSRLRDDNFVVPQMSPASNIASKRSRFLW